MNVTTEAAKKQPRRVETPSKISKSRSGRSKRTNNEQEPIPSTSSGLSEASESNKPVVKHEDEDDEMHENDEVYYLDQGLDLDNEDTAEAQK